MRGNSHLRSGPGAAGKGPAPAGTRTAGMPITSSRGQALLAVLCVFRPPPNGFTHRNLRTCLAPLLGLTPEAMTSGQSTYDLRRLRTGPRGTLERIVTPGDAGCAGD